MKKAISRLQNVQTCRGKISSVRFQLFNTPQLHNLNINLHICISSHLHINLQYRYAPIRTFAYLFICTLIYSSYAPICTFAYLHIYSFIPWLKPDQLIFVRVVAMKLPNGWANVLHVTHGILSLRKLLKSQILQYPTGKQVQQVHSVLINLVQFMKLLIMNKAD